VNLNPQCATAFVDKMNNYFGHDRFDSQILLKLAASFYETIKFEKGNFLKGKFVLIIG